MNCAILLAAGMLRIGPAFAVGTVSPSLTGDTPMFPTATVMLAAMLAAAHPVPPPATIPPGERPRNVRPYEPPTHGIPPGEVPKNVRPWTPDAK